MFPGRNLGQWLFSKYESFGELKILQIKEMSMSFGLGLY